MKKPKIGLALGGGGARGLAHIGVLKILEKNNIIPDFICGVSMGAIIGASYSAGMSVADMEKEAVGLNKRVAVRKLLDLANPRRSIIRGRKAKNSIRDLVQGKKFSECKIPLEIVATDLASGEEVILNNGDLTEAIIASISVPGIFPPVKIGDNYLVDGGVTNPTPVDRLEKAGIDVLIGVDLMMKRNIKFEKGPGMVTTLLQSYEIIRTKAVKYNLKHISKKTVLIKPKLRGTVDSFKFYDIDKFIAAGEEATKEVMHVIKRRIKEATK